MFRFSIRDVLWLTAVGVGAFSCSRSDTAASKERMLQQLREATEINVLAYQEDGKQCKFQLNRDDKARLVTWLQRAVRDDNPMKYEVRAEIAFPKADAWLVLQISDVEEGLRLDGMNYWRGLDRAEFEAILSANCPPK